MHPKLGEHLEHPALSCDELAALVESAADRRFGCYRSRVVPNVNLGVWIALRRLLDLGRPLPGLTHLQRLWQPFYPLMARRLHAEQAYRRVVIVMREA